LVMLVLEVHSKVHVMYLLAAWNSNHWWHTGSAGPTGSQP
jgi:hypothetical protein